MHLCGTASSDGAGGWVVSAMVPFLRSARHLIIAAPCRSSGMGVPSGLQSHQPGQLISGVQARFEVSIGKAHREGLTRAGYQGLLVRCAGRLSRSQNGLSQGDVTVALAAVTG